MEPARRRAAFFPPSSHGAPGPYRSTEVATREQEPTLNARNRAEATAGTGVGCGAARRQRSGPPAGGPHPAAVSPTRAAPRGSAAQRPASGRPAPGPPSPPSRAARVPVGKLRSARPWGSGMRDRRPPGPRRPHDPQGLPPTLGRAAPSAELRWRRLRCPGRARNPEPQCRWQPRSSPGRLRSAPRPRPPLS